MYKKSFYIGAVLLISVVFLAGCSGSDEFVDSTVNRTYQGELSSLATPIRGLDVTHVLVTEAKERIYLRSLLFDLNEYEDLKVKVFGTYAEKEVSEKPVDVITVEKIDVLGEGTLNESRIDTSRTLDKLGIKIGYPSGIFEARVEDARFVLAARESNDVVSFEKFSVSPEQDLSSYQNSEYPDMEFTAVSIGADGIDSLKGVDDTSRIVHLIDRDAYFYDISYVSLDSTDKFELEDVFESILGTLELIELADETETDKDDDIEKDDEDAVDHDDSANGNDASISTSVDIAFQSIIDSFQSQVDRLLSDFESAISYSFSDNNYFYVIYNTDEGKRRALFSYGDRFKKVASFVPGRTKDWRLVEGNNLAFNRPQTLIIVGEDGGATELDLKQGYRFFESIPLDFGFQYPMNWYYARQGNAYLFSDEPVDSGNVLVRVELKDDDFSSFGGRPVTSSIKKQSGGGTVNFHINLDAGVVTVSGSSQFASEIETMATTMFDKDE